MRLIVIHAKIWTWHKTRELVAFRRIFFKRQNRKMIRMRTFFGYFFLSRGAYMSTHDRGKKVMIHILSTKMNQNARRVTHPGSVRPFPVSWFECLSRNSSNVRALNIPHPSLPPHLIHSLPKCSPPLIIIILILPSNEVLLSLLCKLLSGALSLATEGRFVITLKVKASKHQLRDFEFL